MESSKWIFDLKKVCTVIPPPQLHLSCSWMERTSAWRRHRTVDFTRSVVLCVQNMFWPAPKRCLGLTGATSKSATGLFAVSWSGCRRNTVCPFCSAPAPVPFVVRGEGKILCPPVPTSRWMVHSITVYNSRASVDKMTFAGEIGIIFICISYLFIWLDISCTIL